MWDPGTYLRFGTERARPFFDLVSRVQAETPGFVADLGCGPGNLTASLAARWPAARVLGVD
jgi:trans-aconitate 2-methyltransferase